MSEWGGGRSGSLEVRFGITLYSFSPKLGSSWSDL